MIKTYNKLVRDKIPEIIKSKGEYCKTKILNDDKYIKALDAKLFEECAEYQNSKNVEELADILEVVYAIAEYKNISRETLEKTHIEKAQKHGKFKQKIMLIESEVK